MAISVKFDTNIGSLERQFARLPEELRKEFLDKATVDAARYVARMAVGSAPKDTNNLAGGIFVTRAARKSKTNSVANVRAGHNARWYASFVELGTGPRFTGDGDYRGAIITERMRFLRPALYDNAALVRKVIVSSLKAFLRKRRKLKK